MLYISPLKPTQLNLNPLFSLHPKSDRPILDVVVVEALSLVLSGRQLWIGGIKRVQAWHMRRVRITETRRHHFVMIQFQRLGRLSGDRMVEVPAAWLRVPDDQEKFCLGGAGASRITLLRTDFAESEPIPRFPTGFEPASPCRCLGRRHLEILKGAKSKNSTLAQGIATLKVK
jgi:hypothetical protein